MSKQRTPRIKKVKVIKSNETDLLKALWRTGVGTTEQIESAFKVQGNRLDNLIHSGFLEKDKNNIIRIGKEGVKYCKNKLGMNHQYKSAVNKLGHDLKLMQGYIRLNPQMRERWVTENEIKQWIKKNPSYDRFVKSIKEKYGTYKATPDAILRHEDGRMIAFECITKNYKESDIAQKQEFADRFLNDIKYF